QMFLGRRIEGHMVHPVGKPDRARHARLEFPRIRLAMKLPEGDETIRFDFIEEVLRPAADRRRPDFDLLQIEAHDLAIEMVDGLDVARRKGEMMISHGFPSRFTSDRPSA